MLHSTSCQSMLETPTFAEVSLGGLDIRNVGEWFESFSHVLEQTPMLSMYLAFPKNGSGDPSEHASSKKTIFMISVSFVRAETILDSDTSFFCSSGEDSCQVWCHLLRKVCGAEASRRLA